MSYSRKRNVLLWSTLYLTYTYDCHKWGVYVFLQSSHWRLATINSTTKVCYSKVLFMTSFCTVILTFNLLEWGSVQMNPASIIFTLFNPFICFKHKAKSYGDSNSHETHGGLWYLLHSLQWWSYTDLDIPSDMSIFDFRH